MSDLIKQINSLGPILNRTLNSKFLEFILVLIYIKFIKKFLICQESNCISL